MNLTLVIWLALIMPADQPRLVQVSDVQELLSQLQPFTAVYRELESGVEKGRRQVSLQDGLFSGQTGFRHVIVMSGQKDTVYDEWHFTKDLAPVSRVVTCRSLIHQVEVFTGAKSKGVRLQASGEDPQPVTGEMMGDRFPGTTYELVLALVQPEPGYQARFPVYSSDLGSKNANAVVEVRVLKRETLTWAGGQHNTVIVESRFLDGAGNELGFPAVRTWLSPQPPYVMRVERGGIIQQLQVSVLLPCLLEQKCLGN